jgi:hypothetical protein
MRKIFFIIASFITLYSCMPDPVCSGIIVHQVKIVDSLGKPVLLDTFYTVCLDKPDTLRLSRYLKDSLQLYPLIDDTYSSVFNKQSTANFMFIGIKGSDTISSPYLFKYDGCHTSLLSGTSKIIH